MDDKYEFIIAKYDKALDHIIESSKQTQKSYNRLSIALIACILVISLLAFLNNKQWLEVFNSHEYITTTETVTYQQDGADVNSVNLGEMVDLINGSEVDIYKENNDNEEEICTEKGK